MHVAVFGAGGHGRVVLDILLQAGHAVACFLDSNGDLHARRVVGVEVIGGPDRLQDLPAYEVDGVVVAIGDNGVRRAVAAQVDAAGLRLVNAVHPSGNLARTVGLGRNVSIGAAVVQNVRIGREAVVGAGSVIIRPAPTLTPRALVEMVAPAHLREVSSGFADRPAA